jgi:hypothetical protein
VASRSPHPVQKRSSARTSRPHLAHDRWPALRRGGSPRRRGARSSGTLMAPMTNATASSRSDRVRTPSVSALLPTSRSRPSARGPHRGDLSVHHQMGFPRAPFAAFRRLTVVGRRWRPYAHRRYEVKVASQLACPLDPGRRPLDPGRRAGLDVARPDVDM